MKIKTFVKLLATILICSVSIVNAQVKTVSGTISTKGGDVAIGATVIVEGTSMGTSTDTDGKYSLSNVPANAKLTYSYIGFTSQTIAVGSKTAIDVVLSEDTADIDEVIVVGYGTVKKSDLTGSVSRVDAKSMQSQPITQVSDALAGKITGLFVSQGTSAGGGGVMQMRGQSSILASSAPLVVLDGVIYNGSMQDINPADIATVDVLKDASSAAVYGSRAAAGVILITTTKAKKGEPKINFSASVGISETTKDMKPYAGAALEQFRIDANEINYDMPEGYFDDPRKMSDTEFAAWKAMNPNSVDDPFREWYARLGFSDTVIDNYLNGVYTDWYDEAYRTGVRQSYDLNISGATDKMSTYFSFGYIDNEGIIEGDDFEAIRSRLSIDYNLAKFLKIGANVQFANKTETANPVNVGTGGEDSFYQLTPYMSIYDENGDVQLMMTEYAINPFIKLYMKDRYQKVTNLFATIHADLTLPFGITYQLSFQPRFMFNQDFEFNYSSTVVGNGTRKNYNEYEWMVDNLFKWNKEFGKHRIDATFLVNSEKNQTWMTTSSNRNFSPNENLSYHGLDYGSSPAINVYDTRCTGSALMGRLNYTYDNKYLFTASVRKDGYSAFGTSNKHATFPAVALAWQIGREEWFDVEWVDQLKLRLSWGKNGNRDIPIYSSLSNLGPEYGHNGTGGAIGVDTETLSNPDLKWESTESKNIGIDMNILNNRVQISADAYVKTTTDLLMNRALPVTTGYDKVAANLGKIQNAGFELTVNSTNITKENFTWASNFTFSTNKNEIKELFGDYGDFTLANVEYKNQELPDFDNEWFVGHGLDEFWHYKILGVWQTEEAEEAAKYGMKPGDYKAEDVNGDYKYTEQQDKQFLGHKAPQVHLGLTNNFTIYKNWMVSVFLRADLGATNIYNQTGRFKNNGYPTGNTIITPYWSENNPINDWPSLKPTAKGYEGDDTLDGYFNRSFLRVQDISLTYSIPSGVINKLGIDNARVFGSVKNSFCFTKWPAFDPESSMSAMPRIYTLGINISL